MGSAGFRRAGQVQPGNNGTFRKLTYRNSADYHSYIKYIYIYILRGLIERFSCRISVYMY
jgi:hypothetical protein